jgi:hypothetical protein
MKKRALIVSFIDFSYASAQRVWHIRYVHAKRKRDNAQP